jgi:hypothetical protein
MTPPPPSWRKPAGALFILALIAAWAALVASAAAWIAAWAWPLQALFYLATGLVWITPLKPLLRWMETGRFRA